MLNKFTAHQNKDWKFTPRVHSDDVFVEQVRAISRDQLPTYAFYLIPPLARSLLDGLSHACAEIDGAPAPAEPELDPILDAVRERRFADARKMIDELDPTVEDNEPDYLPGCTDDCHRPRPGSYHGERCPNATCGQYVPGHHAGRCTLLRGHRGRCEEW